MCASSTLQWGKVAEVENLFHGQVGVTRLAVVQQYCTSVEPDALVTFVVCKLRTVFVMDALALARRGAGIRL